MKKAAMFMLVLILSSVGVFALDEVDVKQTGALPTNKLDYALKKMFENLDLAFTFRNEYKVQKLEFYARVRESEMTKLQASGDLELIEDVAEDMQKKLQEMQDRSEELPEGDQAQVRERIQTMMQNHVAVLVQVREQLQNQGVPVEGLNNALQNSVRVFENSDIDFEDLDLPAKEDLRQYVKDAESKGVSGVQAMAGYIR